MDPPQLLGMLAEASLRDVAVDHDGYDLVAADQIAVELYNQNNSPSQLAIHNKLVELIEQMREDMNALIVKINNLATPLDL